MPIRTYLEDHSAFSPEEIKAMSKALDEACAALQVAGQGRTGKSSQCELSNWHARA